MTKTPKTRASETMTEAQFVSFVKGHLRRASRWWKPISEVQKEANKARGVYFCQGCQQLVPKSIVVDGKRRNNIFVDHIKPVIDPETGFTTWDDFVEGLFCEKINLQLLCTACHNSKSLQEKTLKKKGS